MSRDCLSRGFLSRDFLSRDFLKIHVTFLSRDFLKSQFGAIEGFWDLKKVFQALRNHKKASGSLLNLERGFWSP